MEEWPVVSGRSSGKSQAPGEAEGPTGLGLHRLLVVLRGGLSKRHWPRPAWAQPEEVRPVSPIFLMSFTSSPGSGSPGSRRAEGLQGRAQACSSPTAGPGSSPGPGRPPWRPEFCPLIPGRLLHVLERRRLSEPLSPACPESHMSVRLSVEMEAQGEVGVAPAASTWGNDSDGFGGSWLSAKGSSGRKKACRLVPAVVLQVGTSRTGRGRTLLKQETDRGPRGHC